MVSKNASASSTDSLKAAYQTAKEDSTKIRILNEIGKKYHLSGQPDSSIAYFKRCLEIVGKSKKNRVLEWSIFSYLGVCHVMKGSYPLGISYYYQALSLAIKLKDSSRIGGSYRGIADCYSRMLKTDTAEVFYNKAIAFLENDPKAIRDYSVALHNKANNLRRAGRYSEALKSYKFNISYLEAAIPTGKANIYQEMGVCYTNLKDFDIAEKYLMESQKLAEQSSEDLKFMVNIYDSLSDLYYLWGKSFKMGEYAMKVFEISSNNNFDYFLLRASKRLYLIHKTKGNIDSALHYHEVYLDVKEKNYKSEQEKAELSVRVEYENSLVKEQNQRQSERIYFQDILQKRLVIFLLVLLILLIIVFFSRKKIVRQRKVIQEQNIELSDFNKKLEQRVIDKTSELNKLNQDLANLNKEIIDSIVKGQTLERKRVALELHDNLGSQLTAIKWLYNSLEGEQNVDLFKDKYLKIKKLINNTYNTVRDISHNIIPVEFEKRGLIGAVEKLFYNMNESGKITFCLDSEGYRDLDKKKELELYHILMELSSNTIKHSNGNKVVLVLRKKIGEERTLIQYSDNTTEITFSKSLGNGMKNIEERLLTINGKMSIEQTVMGGILYNSFTITV